MLVPLTEAKNDHLHSYLMISWILRKKPRQRTTADPPGDRILSAVPAKGLLAFSSTCLPDYIRGYTAHNELRWDENNATHKQTPP